MRGSLQLTHPSPGTFPGFLAPGHAIAPLNPVLRCLLNGYAHTTVGRSPFQSLVKCTVSTSAWAQWVCLVGRQPWSRLDPDVGGMPSPATAYRDDNTVPWNSTQVVRQGTSERQMMMGREVQQQSWCSMAASLALQLRSAILNQFLLGIIFFLLKSCMYKECSSTNIFLSNYIDRGGKCFKLNAKKVYWMFTACRMRVGFAMVADCICLAELN